MHTYDSWRWYIQSEGSGVEGHPCLHNEFKDCLGSMSLFMLETKAVVQFQKEISITKEQNREWQRQTTDTVHWYTYVYTPAHTNSTQAWHTHTHTPLHTLVLTSINMPYHTQSTSETLFGFRNTIYLYNLAKWSLINSKVTFLCTGPISAMHGHADQNTYNSHICSTLFRQFPFYSF